MDLAINPDFYGFKFLKNLKEKNNRISEYLEELAEEAENLARIWEEVIETVVEEGHAEAAKNENWLRLVDLPQWSIYSRDVPKSRLDLFNERMYGLLLMNNGSQTECTLGVIGGMLRKKSLSASIIERELNRLKSTNFFNKHIRTTDEISLPQSIIIVNSEVTTIRTLARNFKVSIAVRKTQKVKSNSQLNNYSGMFFLRKITDQATLNEFKEKYKNASGLDVTLRFLESRDVYATFNRSNRMCGGFVLGSSGQLRTIEVFAGESSKPKLYEFLGKTTCCEVNCFWLSVKNRRGFWSYWFWFLFACKVYMQKEKVVIYGTIARSFANIYGYPKKSKLLHTDELVFDGKLRRSWIFTCSRSYFLRGVMEIFVYKFKNSGSGPAVQKTRRPILQLISR